MKPRELSARIGALLRELRKDRGLSQRGAADAVGAPQPKLSLLESGRLDFGALSLVVRLSEALGVAVVDVLAAALGDGQGEVHRRLDRAWLVSASRLLRASADRATVALPETGAGAWRALTAKDTVGRWVAALVRARAFGAVHGAPAAGWILPFAPALIRQVCEELELSDAGRSLSASMRARIVEEAQRFAVAYELAAKPAEALAVLDRLRADHPIPEIDYMRGVLLHQLGEAPLRVKGCVQQALDALEASPVEELRADLIVAGLLEYLEVAAEASEHPEGMAPEGEQRVDRAIRLLDVAGYTQGRVHLEVRRAARHHERLRGVPAGSRDATWEAEWQDVAARLSRARADYRTMGVAMGAAYVEDWLARHHELAGDHAKSLALLESAATAYRALGQRRWECSAQVRSAYCREQLALAALSVSDDADVSAKRLAGPSGDAATRWLEETRNALTRLLAEPGVTPFELPLLEIHLALASGRLAGWAALRRAPREQVTRLAEGYRASKHAALGHANEEVDASVAASRQARQSFRELEKAYPVLRGAPRGGHVRA